MKGEKVRIPPDKQEAKQIQNHLNVIKSREKKLFTSLGLDFVSTVIKVTEFPAYHTLKDNEQIQYFEISMEAPKSKRKYTVFSVIKQDADNSK